MNKIHPTFSHTWFSTLGLPVPPPPSPGEQCTSEDNNQHLLQILDCDGRPIKDIPTYT